MSQNAYENLINLMFIKTTLHNVIPIKSMLRCFELFSVLKVNFHKSIFWSFGTGTKSFGELCKCDELKDYKVSFHIP